MRTDDYIKEFAPEGWTHMMECGRFKASLKRATRIEDDGEVHGLPSGESIPVFPISSLPACPEEWVRGKGVYVCPVDTNWGLWFDWTMNDNMNTAVVPSVKGMNPITGMEIDGPGLHTYKERCPIHDVEFGPNRLCEECGYRWPSQNYVTKESTLWWDGFRQPDGSVRQFFFTDDDARDIASLVIGKENTVPAFGFVFYEPKNKRVAPPVSLCRGIKTKYAGTIWNQDVTYGYCSGSDSTDIMDEMIGCSFDPPAVDPDDLTVSYMCSTKGAESFSADNSIEPPEPIATKSVSVGAGAKIRQELVNDELGLDGWKEENSGIIRLYFVFEQQFKDIVSKGGVKGIQTNNVGFLNGLPIG